MRVRRLIFVGLLTVTSGCGGSSSTHGDTELDGHQGQVDTIAADQYVPPLDSGSDSATDGALDGTTDGTTDGPEPDAAPALACTSLIPSAGYNGAAIPLAIDGQLFEQEATVELVNLVTNQVSSLVDVVVTDVTDRPGDDHIEVGVAASTAEGTYVVRVSNPGEGTTAECGTYVSTAQPPPTVTTVVPDTAWEGDGNDAILSDQPISITGAGFRPTPAVRFINKDTREIITASSVSWVSETSLTALAPSESQGMAVGDYLVEVVNPNRLSGPWKLPDDADGLFRVTATPPPRIDDVSPSKALANAGGGTEAPAIVVSGDYFDAATKLYLLLAADQEPQEITAAVTAREINATGPDSITFTFDVNNAPFQLTVGMYPLRLVNPDGQFDTFFSMQVENSAEGKLNVGQWTNVTQLMYPRERHDALHGFDVFGNAYLYLMGGTSLPNGGNLATRPRPVLANTEVVQVDVFGEPSAVSQLAMQLHPTVDLSSFNVRHGTLRSANLFNTPRTGLTVVRAGSYLYAIGGAGEDTWSSASVGTVPALDTVERAEILGYQTMPNLSLPRVVSASRGLPRGAWYYRVSAVLGDRGESLPSREVVAQDAAGRVTLKWLPVQGATSYLVYRGLGSDGRLGTTRLIASNVTTTTFTDDGQGVLAPAPGRLAGSVAEGGSLAAGSWTYRVAAVVSAIPDGGETLAGYPVTLTVAADGTAKAIALRWDPIPGATYNVYRAAAPGEEATYLLASGLTSNAYTDQGGALEDGDQAAPEGITPLPAGSLSRWETLEAKLTTGREGAQGIVVRAVDGNAATGNDPSYIFVVGGRADNATGDDSLTSSDRALLGDDGALGAFALATDDTGATVQLNQPRAFFGLVSTQGRNVTPVAPPPEIPPCPDNDGDGFTSCLCGGTDCNDAADTVFPGADEICGDGLDQDCDQGCGGGSDETCPDPCAADGGDEDGDGYKRPACGGTDCNDEVATICPSSTQCPEVCGDSVDQDCRGGDLACDACEADDGDADGDGYKRPACGGDDCDDGDPTICPSYTDCPEIECDGIDQNCDKRYPCLIFNDPNMSSAVTPRVSAYEPRLTQSTPFFPPATQLLANGDEAEDPVYLAAIFGATTFPATADQIGLNTAEVCLVTKQGNLTPWTVQDDHPNQTAFGNDALLYGNFAYAFQGAQTEGGPDSDPNGIRNEVLRFEVNADAISTWTTPVPDDVLHAPNAGWPAGASVPAGQRARCYISAARLSARIFVVAGNGGTGIGPLPSILGIKQ